MNRYIDADDLKAVIKANDWSNPVVPDVVSVIIDRTPTADVAPVVRCKDCKYYKVRETAGYGVRSVKSCCRSANKKVNEEDYCSCGERRENGKS